LEPELAQPGYRGNANFITPQDVEGLVQFWQNWGISDHLAKSCRAPQSNDHMTTGSKRGSGMENAVDEQVRGGASGEVLRFPGQHLKSVAFDRHELSQILNLYGRYVASGEWKDYAMDFTRDKAVFSVFHRAAEQPLYRIVKDPSLARKQGQYAVVAQGGLILKRGHELAQVLAVLFKKPKLAGG
jgi:hypothetical protein